MASVTRLGPWRHLRAEPNQTVLHFSGGKLKRAGAGLAYWFLPLSAAVAQLPVEDCSTTFVLNERSADFQAVTVQVTLLYRIAMPEQAAARVNFSISLASGEWLDRPLDKLATFWAQRALTPARSYLARTPLQHALAEGSERIRAAIVDALAQDRELATMGLQLVGVVIDKIAPSADVEKALQTPTREAIQSKADEAQFQRRALAVEKERAIKENELATELELERKQEMLIRQRGDNALQQVRQDNLALREKADAEATRSEVEARAAAAAQRLRAEAALAEESGRVALWRDAPQPVLLAQVLGRFAEHLTSIGHLNITPDLLGQSLSQFLRDQSAPPRE